MKKVIAGMVSILLLLGIFVMSASAAELNSAEKDLMNYFKSVEIGGKKIPSEYLTQAENWFLLDDVNITETQKNEALTPMKSAVNELNATSVTSWSTLPAAQQKKLIGYAEQACAAVELTFSYDAQTGTAKILDKDGKAIVSANLNQATASVNGVIKPTGVKSADFTLTIAVAGGLVLLLGAALITAKKKGMFHQEGLVSDEG